MSSTHFCFTCYFCSNSLTNKTFVANLMSVREKKRNFEMKSISEYTFVNRNNSVT